ncbi:MAG: tetratricopeptide repeat protein, partial [Bacteroidetes bacterium]|nr:tetratricopeptide repeat protein [Bacteroidota bacterium]
MSRIDLPKIYNPQIQPKPELIRNFVVRLKIFKEIFEDIKTSKMKHPEQHYIIQGIRGQGKTTLLLRIAYEIENDKELTKWLIPVIFSEEPYKIRKLFKLWEVTAEYLKNYKGFENLYNKMQEFENDDDYEIQCFQLLEKTIKQNKKKLILFIDNIGDMFNKFSRKEHHRLREVLIESAEIRIVGASSVSLEFHYDYGKPFFEFFRMPQLRGLTKDETKTLLLSLGEYYKRERVKEIVKTQVGRIEALRRLTGGVIRTIIILFQIFVDDEEGNAFLDLEKILDEVTPLYKDRMDKLPAQQQEIVDFIALSWDAVSTKEIAKKVKEQSKAVSSQLKILKKNNIIEQQGTITKNYLYRLSERFFNIWYLMRHGGIKEENKVKWLVEFLQEWCDEKTLEIRAAKQLEAIQKGNLYEKQALYMTEALASTSIKRDLQDKLIKETRKYLESKKSDLLEYLHPSDTELIKEAGKLFKERKDYSKFISLVEKIRVKDTTDLNVLGQVHGFHFHNKSKSEKFFLEAVEKEDAEAMNNLALLYKTEFKDFKKAEKYYLMAIEKERFESLHNLANLYRTEFKDFKKAEKYYLMAIEKERFESLHNLA